MQLPEHISQKVDLVRNRLLDTYGDAIQGLFIIGGITQESTPTSDLDILAVLDDQYFMEHIDSLKDLFIQTANEINAEIANPLLTLWPSKSDHYLTGFPDVSYVRANLPLAHDRLDAWCGMAKQTLIQYEAASALRIWGNFELKAWMKKIPRWESQELFLIATRTLAEGLSKFVQNDPGVKLYGSALIAKAGLRASYSVLIATDMKPRNTYRAITEDAIQILPIPHKQTLEALYRTRTQKGEKLPSMTDVFDLIHYCEDRIARVPRLEGRGLTMASSGESFGFTIKEENYKDDFECLPTDYQRCPNQRTNPYQGHYSLFTGAEVVKRLMTVHDRIPEVLDLFFEEITTIAHHYFVSGAPLRMTVGRQEREYIDLHFTPDHAHELSRMVNRLVEQLLSDTTIMTYPPWLNQENKRARVWQLLSPLTNSNGTRVDKNTVDALVDGINHEVMINTFEWRSSLMANLISTVWMKEINHQAQYFFKQGLAELCIRMLTIINQQLELYRQIKHDSDPMARKVVSSEEFLKELTDALHYYGVSLHRLNRIPEAMDTYAETLRWQADHPGVSDDATTLLASLDNPDLTEKWLTTRQEEIINNCPEGARIVSDLFSLYAIKMKKKGDFIVAIKWYQHAIEADNTNPRPMFNFGIMQQQRGLTEEAISLYRQAIILNPDYKNAYCSLGYVLEQSDRIEEAVSILQESVARGLGDCKIHNNLGNCLLQLNRHDEARNQFRLALQDNSRHADAMNGMGLIELFDHEQTGNKHHLSKAIQLFQEAIRIDSTFKGAEHNLLMAQAKLFGLSDEKVTKNVSRETAVFHPDKNQVETFIEEMVHHRKQKALLDFLIVWRKAVLREPPFTQVILEQIAQEFRTHMAAFYSIHAVSEETKRHWENLLSLELKTWSEDTFWVWKTAKFLYYYTIGEHQQAEYLLEDHPDAFLFRHTFLAGFDDNRSEKEEGAG
ncbi:MAG: tetratricopeptide repeat protein [SAR324 cluster bacterium]|nr:tetratricopeptide repeat protein [SAR324 cluster bacterium]